MVNKPDRREASDFIIDDEIDELFGYANPNPDRIGCPTRDVLSALSRRERPIGDPGYEHLGYCSPCYRQFRALQEERLRLELASPRRLWWFAAVAAIFVVVAAGAWLYFRSQSSAPILESAVAEIRLELDLRPFTIPRGPQAQEARAPLDLPRAPLLMSLLLPTGSEPGTYDVQLLDAGSQAQASTAGQAAIQNFVTNLEATIDLRPVAAGPYQLALRRPGEDWHLYPAIVK